MWDSLRDQVAMEREQLHRLVESYRPLLEKSALAPPTELELYALAGLLHSFYHGIENVFKRIVQELDEESPHGPAWHREVLDLMAKPERARPAVISQDLVERLDAYLDFRHFFRHSYVFQLRWDRMKPLVLSCEETLRQFEAELDSFLGSGPPPKG